MRSKPPKGLKTLQDAVAALPGWAGAEHDPVVLMRCRYRLAWDAAQADPSLVERVGGRLFVRDDKLPALAAALGVTPAQPRKVRPTRRAAPSNLVAVAA